MLGTEDNPGIMFHTLKELFNKMKDYKIDREFNIRVSFLEIYNEQIRDLIMVTSDVLDLREDPVKGVCVAGLSEIEVDTPEEVLDLLMYNNCLTKALLDSEIEIEHKKPQWLMRLLLDLTQYYKLHVSTKIEMLELRLNLELESFLSLILQAQKEPQKLIT
jgi:hypothetical protein